MNGVGRNVIGTISKSCMLQGTGSENSLPEDVRCDWTFSKSYMTLISAKVGENILILGKPLQVQIDLSYGAIWESGLLALLVI